MSSTTAVVLAALAVVAGCSGDEKPRSNPDAGGEGGSANGGTPGTGGGHAGTGGGQSGAGGGQSGAGGGGGAGGIGGCVPPNVIGYRTAGCGMDAMGSCVNGVAGACAGPVVCGCDGRDLVSRCDGIVVGTPFRHDGPCVVPDGGPDAQPDANDGASDAQASDAQPEAGDATPD